MLIALPVIYVAASFYNGEDPVANVKGWFGVNESAPVTERHEPGVVEPRDAPATFESVQELRAENDRLREALARCQNTSGS